MLFGSVPDPRQRFDTDPDPYQWIMDPDPTLFYGGFQGATKNNFFFLSFFAYFLL
jgi:hypothetical protein